MQRFPSPPLTLQLPLPTSPNTHKHTHTVVKAHFPQHKLSDIDLDVTKDVLKAVSDSLSLTLYLPTSVDADEGSATFDSCRDCSKGEPEECDTKA